MEILAERLRALDAPGLRRHLRPATGVDLCSNDYLGLARDPELARRAAVALADFPSGAAGSRLLRGESELHETTETVLARAAGRESAVLFPSGYQANLALLSSLLRPGDQVFSDALNHASIIDALRLGRAERHVYPHADAAELGRLLDRTRPTAAAPGALRLFVTESLFSMDGDAAPLAALCDLAEEHSALLVVDEAHATGLYGATGGGLAQAQGLSSRIFATVHTGGKALGVGGAWVAGDRMLKDYLVNFSRPFIFSTAPIPALCLLLRLALERWGEVGPERAPLLLRRAARLREKLRPLSRENPQRLMTNDPGPASGPILPFILGDNKRAVDVAEALRKRGFDARAVRPPTVPLGTARLRLTVTWPVPDETLDRFVLALRETLAEIR
ncbi:MAG TPA: aminotransferase class I/II-fold pyridoxal phosphate-dependent enzyme [Candidatus Polarisedimenticolia bacterium]